MKASKKTGLVAAFVAGTMIFASTALADLFIGSGYEDVKTAAKQTGAYFDHEAENFTLQAFVTQKIDDTTFSSGATILLYDQTRGAQYEENRFENLESGAYSRTYYTTQEKQIYGYLGSGEERYTVYTGDVGEAAGFDNPFERKETADFENLLDALMGSLQDAVQGESVGDSVVFTVDLDKNQIPALQGALLSFAVKQGNLYDLERMGLPSLTSNVAVESITGKAVCSSDGILQDGIASLCVSGNDKAGRSHTYTLEIALSVTDVNTTEVTEPDLAGKTVEVVEVPYPESGAKEIVISDKYMGTYRQTVLEDTGDAICKAGTNVLTVQTPGEGVLTRLDAEGSVLETYRLTIDGDQLRLENETNIYGGILWRYGPSDADLFLSIGHDGLSGPYRRVFEEGSDSDEME